MTARSPVVHVKRAAYDVYVGRPSPFGNPFVIGRDGDRATVLARYRAWLLAQPALVELVRRDLAGKVLGCWCAHCTRRAGTRRPSNATASSADGSPTNWAPIRGLNYCLLYTSDAADD